MRSACVAAPEMIQYSCHRFAYLRVCIKPFGITSTGRFSIQTYTDCVRLIYVAPAQYAYSKQGTICTLLTQLGARGYFAEAPKARCLLQLETMRANPTKERIVCKMTKTK